LVNVRKKFNIQG
jgi:hypothetical protein